jgi:selenide,water dikinase
VEPIYGLVALGLVHPDRVLTNRGAKPGDRLLLTKGLGVGVLSAAFRQERLDAAGYAALIDSTTRLNRIGPALGALPGVHAMTDVTGFGLLGHALEMARGSGLCVELDAGAPALLPGVEALLAAGVRTGASARNWASYGESVEGLGEGWRRDLLTDPQTSGGLLVAVSEDEAQAALALAQDAGFAEARFVGHAVEGSPMVRVTGAR